MDHHHYLLLGQPEAGRDLRLKHFLDVLHFEEVIAAAQRADLRAPALLGAIGYLRGVGAGHSPGFFAELHVGGFAIAAFDYPRGAALEHIIQILPTALHEALGAGAGRHIAEELID